MSARARPFTEARRYVHTLGVDSPAAWRTWVRSAQRLADIPQHPRRVYRGCGWAGWQDWLGTAHLVHHGRAYRPFGEARAFARSLGLRSEKHWRAWARTAARPADIPAEPARTYRAAGWAGMGDWLGTGRASTRQRRYRAFAAARRYAQSLGLDGVGAWLQWCAGGQRPADIPAHPERTYRARGWAGWGDFLGTQRVATRQQRQRFRPYAQARGWVHTLGLRSQGEWRAWCRSGARPPDIPASPHRTYRGRGWTHWGDWLGSGAPPRRHGGRP